MDQPEDERSVPVSRAQAPGTGWPSTQAPVQQTAGTSGQQEPAQAQPLQIERRSSRSLEQRYPQPASLEQPEQLAQQAGGEQPEATCSRPSSADPKGWRKPPAGLSLPEVHSSITVGTRWHQKVMAFSGVGVLVAVGYMDPGNWATDLSAGSEFGYLLLFAVLMSSLGAMFLQYLSLKLGIATDRDLAMACRDAYPRWLVYVLWVMAEIAIAATDLAEVIGSATALYLLFGLPLWAGVLITCADVLFILAFGTHNFRVLELLVFLLIATICGCFVYELAAARPDWGHVGKGFIPKAELITDADALFNAIGILGATIMPHNIILHSSIIQTRAYPRTTAGKRMAVRFGAWDSAVSLTAAFFVNAAILILAAAAFYYHGNRTVAYITDAYNLISGAVGAKGAKVLFGVALLASGQNATITGTLAGQVVLEGFLDIQIPPWLRRLLTRMISIIPAAIVASVFGNSGAGKLLVISQVVLSLTLVFIVAPLAHFTCSTAKMGPFVNTWLTKVIVWAVTLLIAVLNAYLIVQSIRNNEFGSTTGV